MASEIKPTLRGCIIDPDRNLGIEGVCVEVLDRNTNSVVAVAWSDEVGLFHTDIPELPKGESGPPVSPTIPIRLGSRKFDARQPKFRQPEESESSIKISERYELRLTRDFDAVEADFIEIHADRVEAQLLVKPKRKEYEEIMIENFNDLEAKEEEIVDRINRLPNGGQLFLIHPFMTLAEVGVVVEQRARDEIIALEPVLNALSPIPFHALRNSKDKQNVRVKIRGLFKRRLS